MPLVLLSVECIHSSRCCFLVLPLDSVFKGLFFVRPVDSVVRSSGTPSTPFFCPGSSACGVPTAVLLPFVRLLILGSICIEVESVWQDLEMILVFPLVLCPCPVKKLGPVSQVFRAVSPRPFSGIVSGLLSSSAAAEDQF